MSWKDESETLNIGKFLNNGLLSKRSGKTGLLLFMLLFTVNYSLFSQNQKQLVKVGDQLTEDGDHYGASLWYKKALDLDSTYIDIVYKYAESLRQYNDYKKAESKYYYIYKKDMGRNYPLAPFWYAMMQKYNGKYSEAKKSFKRAKRFFTRDRNGYHYQKVMQEIKACDVAQQIMQDSVPVHIKNMGESINTYSSELGGTLLDDSTVIFSSLRDEKMKEDNVVMDTSLYLVRLFKGSKQGDVWMSDEKLNEKINEPNYHIANGSLDPEGKTFYYTKCDRSFHCKIYAIEYAEGDWGIPYEIKEVNIDGATTTHPSIAKVEGKDVLFFSSDRPGGQGGKDIWFSRKNDQGKFMAPANAGKEINSLEDEITPFYNEKDTNLYFSSNWHAGLGGFDIFKSRTDLITFGKPENMGFPINTSTNDFYYNIRNKTALITSNRKGSHTKKGETCCNDIWEYEIPDTTEIIYTTLEELNRYLPVRLYFHNDCPNPRSRDTLTTLNYMTTYKDYTRLYNEYRREYSNGLKGEEKDDAMLDIEDLFSENIDKGAKDLELFTPLLLKELEAGKTVTLTIKGFASPLSKSDYNVNLTLRRVSSLINYLSEYENGKILPYINGTAENGAKLAFIKVPFGEYQSVKGISDDLADKRNSVYSPGAALERKIEIIAIQADDTNQVALDGSELEKLPLLTFRDSVIKMTVGEHEKQIKIINNGEAPLKIFSATFSCDGFTIDLPAKEIPRMEPLMLNMTYNPTEDVPKKCTVEFLTNTIPNKIKKEIWIE
ncbi:MAG: DUF1573 domain-containing protein [Flavobacteriales bacterium]|nr:DUF1573 domain-containing protein [Flavobacteriales bacterium]